MDGILGLICLIVMPLLFVLIYELFQRYFMITMYIIISPKEYFIVECPLGLSKIFKFHFWNCHKRGYPIVLREDNEVLKNVIRNRKKLSEDSIPQNYIEVSKRCKVKIL